MDTADPSPVRSVWRRRAWLGGAGLGAAGLSAGLLYRAFPSFWKQYAHDLGRPMRPAPHRPQPLLWPSTGVHAAWLGHATNLLKVDGFTILTDPVFSAWIGLGIGPFTLGLKRLVAPALETWKLPRIDLILLSHAHMDHMDIPSLRALESPHTKVVAARNTSDLIRVRRYLSVQEIGWGETVRVGPASIRAFEVRHWGARMRTDTWRGYNAYLIEIGRHRILFAGDTALTDTFRQIGGAELAIMPIGAYNPWIRVHCNPEQAWSMANDARADVVLPNHHQTFSLSREPFLEPIERLLASAGGRGEQRVPVRLIGQEIHLS